MTNRYSSGNNTINTIAENYLMDADLLPIAREAAEGCFDSQVTIIGAFTDGEGAKPNPILARFYEEMLFKNTDNEFIKLEILWNYAMAEKNAQNYSAMVEKFQDVIDFMQEHIPMSEWDFSLFAQMKEYIQLLEID